MCNYLSTENITNGMLNLNPLLYSTMVKLHGNPGRDIMIMTVLQHSSESHLIIIYSSI